MPTFNNIVFAVDASRPTTENKYVKEFIEVVFSSLIMNSQSNMGVIKYNMKGQYSSIKDVNDLKSVLNSMKFTESRRNFTSAINLAVEKIRDIPIKKGMNHVYIFIDGPLSPRDVKRAKALSESLFQQRIKVIVITKTGLNSFNDLVAVTGNPRQVVLVNSYAELTSKFGDVIGMITKYEGRVVVKTNSKLIIRVEINV